MSINKHSDVYENLSKTEYIRKANANNRKVLGKEVECRECKSKYVDIIDCDEYLGVLRCLCMECGEPFTILLDD